MPTPHLPESEIRKGLFATVAAFAIWGAIPLYFRLLAEVPAIEIAAHRVLWCGVFAIGYLLLREGGGWISPLLRQPRLLLILALSSALMTLCMGLFIWAINAGRVVEVSLGFFITPLINVVLGVAVLRERLTGRQWLAVSLAALAVIYLGWIHEHPPWTALVLAFSFGIYGLLRKIAVVDPVQGLAVESAYMLLPAIGFVVVLAGRGEGALGRLGPGIDALLLISGLITAALLILFAYGARRIRLSTLGIVQYLEPTLQLLIGVLIFGEPFPSSLALGFACIWIALALYAFDGFRSPQPS